MTDPVQIESTDACAGIAGFFKSLTSSQVNMIPEHTNAPAGDAESISARPTLFADAPRETCKTCNTCAEVTNNDFMTAVFPRLPDLARPGVVSFRGNPKSGNWTAHPFTGQDLDKSANNYFAISSYYNDDAGQFKRTKKTFAALHCVVLDDLGSKIDRDRVTLPLSWLIETSAGNYQGGFLLAEPLTDAAMADRLMAAIIGAGLCDAGAGGPTARLMRLPVAVNGKTDPATPCRLAEWQPDRRYTIDELVAGLGLELPSAGRPKQQSDRTTKNNSNRAGMADEDVFTPRPSENPVIAALSKHNWYKSPLGDGKHDITCPWADEHTDGLDTGAAYWEPDDRFPLGGFKCQHSHGDRLHIRDLLGKLEVMASDARMKPVIRVQAGRMHPISDRAEQQLAESGHYYQSAGLLVTVQTDPTTRETAIVPVSQPTLLRALSRVADWQRYDSRSEDWVTADPPAKVVSVLFEETLYPHLPALRGIARQPHLRDDGSVVSTAGYDRLTGRYGVFDPRQYPIPDRPDKEAAQAALGVLLELLEEVAFESPVDQSAALAAMLTAAVRPSLPTAPGFHVCAHTIGSGKSFLTRIIGALATPQAVPGIAFLRDADEMRKTLIAFLIKSPAVINFDDMSNDILPSEALKTALTEEHIAGRLLGVSKDVNCSTRTLFLFSGNNVQPVADMARRIITIHLDPKHESPATRSFKKPHREEEARRDRGRYVAAALTITRAWMLAGSPKTAVKPVASYGRWADWCRHPLLWLGQPDPAQRLFEQLAHDPDAELLGRVLQGWHKAYGDAEKLVRDIVEDGGAGNADLNDALIEAAGERGEINSRLLGWWLKRHAGRIIGGMRLERGDATRGAVRWKVQVSQVLQVPAGRPVESVSSAVNDAQDWEAAL